MRGVFVLLASCVALRSTTSGENAIQVGNTKSASGTLHTSDSETWEFFNDEVDESPSVPKHLLITIQTINLDDDLEPSSRCSFDDFLFEIREGENRQKLLKDCDAQSLPERMTLELPATIKLRWGRNTSAEARERLIISYFFVTDPLADVIYLSCGHLFETFQNSIGRWLQCPADCIDIDHVPVIGGQYEQYGEKSSICRSAIHSGAITNGLGGVIRIEPQRSPLDLRESFSSIMSNSISSLDGPGGAAFQIRSQSTKLCAALPLAIGDEQVTSSSFLHKYIEPHVDGVEPVETMLNWVASHAVSKSASPWAPALDDVDPWIQIDFQSLFNIEKIETAGSTISPFDFKPNQFTVKIRNHSHDAWVQINLPQSDEPKIFDATGQPSRHHFASPLLTKEMRIYPKSSDKYPVVALKIKLYGCKVDIDTNFQFAGNSMVLIGVIVGLAIIALMLASVSLLLIRRSRTSNMATFAKTGSLKGNIYTHQPNTETIRNMKYVNYRNNNFRCEVEYSTPFVSPVMRKDANVVRNHEYSDIDTLPLASSVQFQLHHPDVLNGNKSHTQCRLDYDTSYDDHTYSTIG